VGYHDTVSRLCFSFCHSRRESAVVLAFAFLFVIPVGNLLLNEHLIAALEKLRSQIASVSQRQRRAFIKAQAIGLGKARRRHEG